MTKTHRVGYAISLAAHLVIAAAFLAVPLERMTRQKSVVLDFSIVKGPTRGTGGPGAIKTGEKDLAAALEKKNVTAERPLKHDDHRMTAPVQESPDTGRKQVVSHTDPAGQVSITGENAAAGHAAFSAPDGSAGGPGRPGTKVLNYSGAGGVDERSFSFIRDRIIQNIIYPERARRMGWEGKVTLSFIVHENGSIDDVKIVNSSGFAILDENAKDAVAKTNFKRKVPVRLVVLLPVEYRLRQR